MWCEYSIWSNMIISVYSQTFHHIWINKRPTKFRKWDRYAKICSAVWEAKEKESTPFIYVCMYIYKNEARLILPQRSPLSESRHAHYKTGIKPFLLASIEEQHCTNWLRWQTHLGNFIFFFQFLVPFSSFSVWHTYIGTNTRSFILSITNFFYSVYRLFAREKIKILCFAEVKIRRRI